MEQPLVKPKDAASDRIMIQFESEGSNVRAALFDTQGKIVDSFNLSENTYVDVAHIAAGLYVLQVFSAQKIHANTLIISR